MELNCKSQSATFVEVKMFLPSWRVVPHHVLTVRRNKLEPRHRLFCKMKGIENFVKPRNLKTSIAAPCLTLRIQVLSGLTTLDIPDTNKYMKTTLVMFLSVGKVSVSSQGTECNDFRRLLNNEFKGLQGLSSSFPPKTVPEVKLYGIKGRQKIDLITLNVKLTLRKERGVSWVWD